MKFSKFVILRFPSRPSRLAKLAPQGDATGLEG
jgi:hypothetical protein